jgi:hypothetical protein
MVLPWLLLVAAGCGDSSASVSGRVTLNGKPLTGGAVTFHAAGGRTEGSWIDPEGHYAIARAPVGEVKVTVVVNPTREPPKLPRKRDVPQHPESQAAEGAPAGKAVAIPPRYKDPEKSGLTYTLSRGPQVIDIDLKP